MTTGAGSRPGDGRASANPGETVSASSVARSFAFPRRLRIRKRKHFLAVQARARRLQTPLATLLWRANDVGITRLGITTSKKVGNAPVRNRIRRKVREAFRLLRHELPAGFDLVVVARSEARNAGLQDLMGVLQQWAIAVQRATRRTEGDANP